MTKTKISLSTWIFIAMAAGILVGLILGSKAIVLAPLGSLFIHLIKMVIMPLILFSIILGALSLQDLGQAGKLGLKTFAYYITTTLIAVSLGILFASLFKPGVGLDQTGFQALLKGKSDVVQAPSIVDTLLAIIPQNPFQALAQGETLPVIFFALFLGFALVKVKGENRDIIIKACQGINDALIWMVQKIMWLAPLGIFGLMAEAVNTIGFATLVSLLKFLVLYVLVMAFHGYGVYGLVLKIFTDCKPMRFFRIMRTPQLVAFTTSSSLATLPVNMETCQHHLGVNKETTSFVLPLGATINMDGNAIYYGMAAVFTAQLFGIHLSITDILFIIFTATLGSIGQAGVPGPSFLLVAVLNSARLPLEILPLFIAVDRIFDMIRTAVNITGDAVGALFVEGKRKNAPGAAENR